MGLVNFVEQFVPDLATAAKLIRRVTHKAVKFTWGNEQQIAFEKVKLLMARPET